jgi:hypothetical protein
MQDQREKLIGKVLLLRQASVNCSRSRITGIMCVSISDFAVALPGRNKIA